jgi:predicted metal-dependent peptidase
MRFNKVIGKCDPKIVQQVEDKLSTVFTELSLSYENKSLGSHMGGDNLVFQLVYTLPHILDATSLQLEEMKKKEKEQEEKISKGETIPEEEKISDDLKHFREQMGRRILRTAATDGRRFYWNPEFVLGLSKIGLRLVIFHEAFHAIFLHPNRRGSRIPQLFNIAVDYRVNYSAMEDLRVRDIKDYPKVFTDNLGEYILLEEYAAFLKNPFQPPERLAHLNPTEALRKMADPAYKDPYEDREPMYYADPHLSADMKRPENVYDYLLAQIPKCPVCGKLGKYKKPEEYKALQKQIEEQEKKKAEKEKAKEKAKEKDKQNSCCKDHDHKKHEEEEDDCCDHDHGNDDKQGKNTKPGAGKGKKSDAQPSSGQGQSGAEPSPGQGQSDGSCCEGEEGNCCPGCGGEDYEYVDPFGAGETLDDHIDSDISEDELAKRLTDATEMAKRMGGRIPGGLEDELGILTAPQLTAWDFIRSKILKHRNGYGKPNWLSPKTRPMFAGLYVPKKRDHFINFLAAYDCSGSMSQDDIAYGVSQLQCIDEKGEGYLLPWDSGEPYWDSAIKIKKANIDELKNAKVKGRGGTNVKRVFETYEEHIGKVDIIIIITDGFLYENELSGVKPDKNTDVVWIITSHNLAFKPSFGRVFHLRGEKL